jgi:small subunit ribosomal protein S18
MNEDNKSVSSDDSQFSSLIRPNTNKRGRLYAAKIELDASEICHKNIRLLKGFVSPGGRMLSRRLTGLSAKQQRKVRVAVKRARILALLPFCDTHK